jgi:acetyltransferase
VLVMNVQTAIARADDIAAAVIGVVGKYRAERRMSPKPVLAVWVGADQPIGDLLSGAGIPNYQTGGDAVLGFMHLVRHREAVEALAQVPPAMPSEFAPDTDAARQIVAAALADDRSWLDPIEVKRLFDAYEIAVVPTFAAANAEEAVAHANAIFAQGSTVVLKIMSRDIVHKSDVGGVILNLTTPDEPQQTWVGVEVNEVTTDRSLREIFRGWMLAESPALNAVQHPVYDVWLTSCKMTSDVPPPGAR